jgi:hypothetical protein
MNSNSSQSHQQTHTNCVLLVETQVTVTQLSMTQSAGLVAQRLSQPVLQSFQGVTVTRQPAARVTSLRLSLRAARHSPVPSSNMLLLSAKPHLSSSMAAKIQTLRSPSK